MSNVALENFLTVTEAADVIGCTTGRVRQLLLAGSIIGKKFTKRSWAVDRDSARRYAARKKTTGRPRVHA